MSDRCRSCNAEIMWIEINGKRIPLNVKQVVGYQTADPLFSSERMRAVAMVYTSHFTTCPQATQWSKKGKGKQPCE